MDFTPPSNSNPPIQQPTPISSFPPSQKLPIKRKTLTLTTPKLESTTSFTDDDDVTGADHDVTPRHTPFKFHRIWTEPDEIRLLQGLLDCSSQGLSFPRDLGIFYARFCGEMSQPYSKSQISEKLRRLRKKFRVMTSRICKGLDQTLLSPQDRALFDLSKQLWEPDLNCKPIDPIVNNHNCKSNSIGIKFDFSPSMAVLALPSVIKQTNNHDNSSKINNISGLKRDFNREVKLNYVKVELKRNDEIVRNEVRVKSGGGDLSSEVVRIATKTLADVVDQSLKEIRMMIDVQSYEKLEKDIGFEKRWRDQHIAEFDVLAKRLKLILEHSNSSLVSK